MKLKSKTIIIIYLVAMTKYYICLYTGNKYFKKLIWGNTNFKFFNVMLKTAN